MPIGGDFFGRRFGQQINYITEAAANRRGIQKLIDKTPGPEPVIVESFDFVNQRVDLRLKNYPEYAPLLDVPIAGVGGALRIYRSFKSIKKDGVASASTGLLVPLRSDSRTSFDKRGYTRAPTPILWNGESWVFVPEEALMLAEASSEPDIKDKNATTTQPDKFGPDDVALVHASGSHIIFKGNGDIVIKAANKLYIADDDTMAASMKEVARKGDAVSVDTGTGVGTITGGSTKVYSG